jgi:hypothetical protein
MYFAILPQVWERTVSARVPSRRYDSVQQDWRGILPFAKGSFFADHIEKFENTYLMFSVSLDEAIALQRQADWPRASQGVAIVAELCARLALRINAVLHAMSQHARHFGIVPNLSPLNASNFHSDLGQRAARHSSLISHVLLSERSQFLNKLNTLEEIVDELGDGFIQTAEQLAAGTAGPTGARWQFLDLYHFDLNTCLRETEVLLKSFLFVLPEEQLPGFDFTVSGLVRARRPRGSAHAPLIRARRMPAVAGE